MPRGGVAIPRLDGVPLSHCLFGGEKIAATVAMTLLRADVADAGDWRPGTHPLDLVESGIDGFIARHGGPEIRKQFSLYVGLSSRLGYESRGEESASRLFLVVDPHSAGFVVMGETIAILERIDPRLAAWFYRAMVGSLQKWVRVYDHHDALDRREIMEQYYECEPEGERPELPDVEGCIPASVKGPALSNAAVSKLRLAGRARRLVLAAAEVAASRSPKNAEPITEEEREAFMDSNPPLPSLLAVFKKHDMIEAAFDEEAQGMNEVEPEPNVVIPFDGSDVSSCKRAFRAFGAMCQTLTAASRLIGIMPGNVSDINAGGTE